MRDRKEKKRQIERGRGSIKEKDTVKNKRGRDHKRETEKNKGQREKKETSTLTERHSRSQIDNRERKRDKTLLF